MAKRTNNKSQAIRDYILANPTASAKEVVAALAKKRMTVSAGTVASVKSKAGLSKSRKPKSGKKYAAKATSPRANTADQALNVSTLFAAKKLCLEAGSAEDAMRAIQTISKLDSLA